MSSVCLPTTFSVKDGHLHFHAWVPGMTGVVEGLIPEPIVNLGPDNCRTYVEEKVRERERQLDLERQTRRKRLAEINIPITTRCEGVELRGRIVWSQSSPMAAVDYLLEFPEQFAGTETVTSFGHRYSGGIFTNTGLKPEFVKRGEQELILLYQKRKSQLTYPKLHQLADKLNKR